MTAPFNQKKGNRLQPWLKHNVPLSHEARRTGRKPRSVISMHQKELLFAALRNRKHFLREVGCKKTKEKKRLGVHEHRSGALVDAFYGSNCGDEQKHALLSCREA